MNKESQSTLQKKFKLDEVSQQARVIEFKSDYRTDYKAWQQILNDYNKDSNYSLKPKAVKQSELVTSVITDSDNTFKEELDFGLDHEEVLTLFAQVAQKQQDFLEAKSIWQNIREKYPENKLAYFQAGDCLTSLGEFYEAKKLLKEATKKWPYTPESFAGLAAIPQKQKKWLEALVSWQLVHKRFPEFMPPYIEIGNILLELGKPKEARTIFKEAGKIWFSVPQPLEGLVLVAMHLQHWTDALEQWQKLIERFPEHMEAHIQKGYTLIKLEKFAEAELHFKQLIKKFPYDFEPMEGLANTYENFQLLAQSLEIWEEIIKKFPYSFKARLSKGNLLIELACFEEAKKIFNETARLWPSLSEPAEGLARISRVSKRFFNKSDTVEYWQAVTKKFPQSFNSRMQLGRVLIRLGRFEEGKSVFKEALANWPNDEKLLVELARACQIAQQWSESLKYWQNVNLHYPNNALSYIKQAYIYITLEQYEKAREKFFELVKRPNILRSEEDIHDFIMLSKLLGKDIFSLAISSNGSSKSYLSTKLQEYQDLGFQSTEKYTINPKQIFLVADKLDLIYCPIFKNACTLFKYFVLQNSKNQQVCENIHKIRSHDLAHYYSYLIKVPSLLSLKDHRKFKFTVLRNPLKRLVSAYLDKFVKDSNVEGFARTVIYLVQKRLGIALDMERSITFNEFVNYICGEKDFNLNEHWLPQYCSLGPIKYDYYVQFENLEKEIPYLEKRFNLQIMCDVTPHRTNYTLEKKGNLHYSDQCPSFFRSKGLFPRAREFYTLELEQKVRKRYAEDIELYELIFNKEVTLN